MFSSYVRVLGRPGALAFSATGLIARLPISMVGLGIVLLITGATGSYGLAGSVSAVYLIANAALSIAHGRLVDTFGQRRVLPGVITGFAVALTALLVAVETDQPIWLAYLCAALTGALLPQVGSCVRARWSHLLHDPQEMHTAYSIEGVVDEAVFILGPILVTVLATAWHPVAGLVTAILTGFGGTVALAAQRRTEPPVHPRRPVDGSPATIPWVTLAPLTASGIALGGLFGGVEVATVAFSEAAGVPGMAGALLGLWAFGSLTSGLVNGAIHWRSSPGTRVRLGTVVLTLALVPPPFVESVPAMAVALFVAGIAVSPTLIAMVSLAERILPPARLTEGFALLHTGIAGGVAPGAAIGGVLIDARGASAAYVVSVTGAALAATAAAVMPRRHPPLPSGKP